MLGGTINIILICGGRLDGDLAGKSDGNVKALLHFNNRTLLSIALCAVEEWAKSSNLPCVDEVAVVGGDEIAAAVQGFRTGLQIRYVRESVSGVDNIHEAIKSFSRPAPVLVISPDLPFITDLGISDLVSQLLPTDEIAVATITKDSFLSEFNGAKNRFERIQSEWLTLASVFYFRPQAFISNVPFFRDMFRLRKNPLKLALLLGIDLIFKLIFRLASIGDIEQRGSRLCGCNVRAVRCSRPELAYDIDNLENFQFALQHISKRSNNE